MIKTIITYCKLLIGGALQGTAMTLFLFPHDIPSGGAAGLTILLNYFFQIPYGLALWIVNFSMLILAVKFFGYLWTLRTMFSVTVTSITIILVTAYIPLPNTPFIFDLVIGSFIFGVGVGLLIKSGASSGGMVIPALILAMYKKWSPGKAMFWVNLMVFLVTALVIDLKIILFAIACQWFSTKIIDAIQNIKLSTPLQPVFAWRKK